MTLLCVTLEMDCTAARNATLHFLGGIKQYCQELSSGTPTPEQEKESLSGLRVFQ